MGDFISGLFGGGGNPGPDPAAVQAAQEAQAKATADANRIAQEQAQHQQELNNMNKNFAANLANQNRAMVEAAGSANDAAAQSNDVLRRRRAQTSLASTLGITV